MQTQKQTNLRKTVRTGTGCTFLLVAVACAGCASQGYHKSNAAAVSMEAAAQEVRAEAVELETTMEALRRLVNDPGTDLRRPYNQYSASLGRLIAAAKRTEATGKRMQATSAAYLEAWDRQLGVIDFDHVREVSQTRKTEVAGHFEAVTRRYEESQTVMTPLISYLKDIKEALNTDLTSSGLESMKGVAQNAYDNGAKVQIALAALVSELTSSSTRMSSVAYRPAQPNAAGKN